MYMENSLSSAKSTQVITWRSRAGRQTVVRPARGGVGHSVRWRPWISFIAALVDVHLEVTLISR